MGVVGTLATAYLAGRATVDAVRIVDAEDEARLHEITHPEEDVPVPFKEVVRLTWKLYIPALSTAAVTVTCIILANHIGTRRAAALAAAYSISEKAFDEYRAKIREKVGEKQEREFRDELAQERVLRNPPPANVVVPGALEVLCYDEFSNRWFPGSMENIKRGENNINWKLIHHDRASLNEWYSEVGLDPVQYGERVGWTAMRKLEIGTTSVLRADGVPAISIHFSYDPDPMFDDLHA